MIKFLMIIIVLFCGLYTDAPLFSVVVCAAESGEPTPRYGGLYMVGRYDEGYFFPTWVAV
jgi:hypothetical protein